MANISVTNTFSNSTTADATQVNQNFSDIINGTSDGTKDFSISALTVGGTLTAHGNVTLGNASSDDLSITASLASSLAIKTTATYNVGSSTLGLLSIYLGNSTFTTRLLSGASASWTLTLPATAGTANYIMTTNGSGVSAWTAITNSAWYADGSKAGTVSTTTQTIAGAKTLSGALTLGSSLTLFSSSIGAGSYNGLDVTGLTVLQFASGSGTTINGFANGVNGQIIHLVETGGGGVTLVNNNGSGTQQINTGIGADITLNVGGATLVYMSSITKWIVIGYNA